MVSFLNSWNDVNRTLSHYFLPLCSSSTVPVLCFIHHHHHYLPSGVQFTRSLCQLSVLDIKQNKNTQNIHIFESHKPFRLAITKPSRAPHMLCCMRPSNGRGWWANHPVHHHHHRINLWQATAYLLLRVVVVEWNVFIHLSFAWLAMFCHGISFTLSPYNTKTEQ